MTKKKTPKWGYRSKVRDQDDASRTYTDDDIRNLADEYGFEDPEEIDLLQRVLDAAAINYRHFKTNENEAPRPSEMRPAVIDIKGLVDQLLSRLEDLDESTSQIFWQPETDIENLINHVGFPKETTTLESPYGHKIALIPDGEDALHYSYLEQDDHFESLSILKRYCEAALEAIPNDPGAARSSEALCRWAANIQFYWVNHFGRNFTLDSLKGQPQSDAARFCCDAFKVIDPKVPPSKVQGSMKKVIARKKKKRAGKE
jgi:hypothetical protein